MANAPLPQPPPTVFICLGSEIQKHKKNKKTTSVIFVGPLYLEPGGQGALGSWYRQYRNHFDSLVTKFKSNLIKWGTL